MFSSYLKTDLESKIYTERSYSSFFIFCSVCSFSSAIIPLSSLEGLGYRRPAGRGISPGAEGLLWGFWFDHIDAYTPPYTWHAGIGGFLIKRLASKSSDETPARGYLLASRQTRSRVVGFRTGYKERKKKQ